MEAISTALSNLVIYIPGIVLFLVGSRMAGSWLKGEVFGSRLTAKVVSCNHVLKKDPQGREVYNYYNVLVEYTNPKNNHVERFEQKSLFTLEKGQSVKICIDRKGNEPYIAGNTREYNLHPAAMTVVGIFLILLALEINRGQELLAAGYFALALIVGGGSLVVHHITLRKHNLLAISGEVVEVYKRQISKETKILKGAKYTNYPIVAFDVNGQKTIFRPEINSGDEKMFKVGDAFPLYFDETNEEIYEKAFSIGYTVLGIVLAVLGIVILASAISVIV